MQILQAQPRASFDSTILSTIGLRNSWFQGSPERLMKSAPVRTVKSSTVTNSHLGVLRPETPTFERQRRYDFWFRRP